MINLLIGCPVKRPWVLLEVSCSTWEVSYIFNFSLWIFWNDGHHMLQYCEILEIKIKLVPMWIMSLK